MTKLHTKFVPNKSSIDESKTSTILKTTKTNLKKIIKYSGKLIINTPTLVTQSF